MQKPDERNRNEWPDPEKNGISAYSKYMGVAFQMMAIIAASAFIGYKIDEWYGHEVQWVTALSSVLGVCVSIYQIIRQLKA